MRLDRSYRGYVVCGRGTLQAMLEDYRAVLSRHAQHDEDSRLMLEAVDACLHIKDTVEGLKLVHTELPKLFREIAPLGTLFLESADGMKFVEMSYDLRVALSYEQYEYLKGALETALIGAYRMPRKKENLELLQVLLENSMEVAYGAVHKEG